MDNIVACQTCGLVQTIGSVPKHSVAHCARCNFQLVHRRRNSRLRTLVFSLAALILYFPSNIYPLVTTEYHGLHSETTIFKAFALSSVWANMPSVRWSSAPAFSRRH